MVGRRMIEAQDHFVPNGTDSLWGNAFATDITSLTGRSMFKNYIGHLRGEVTGAVSGAYAVSSADKSAIRSHLGETATIGNIYDIDKNGLISNADVAAMHTNTGNQMANVTTYASPLADLTREQSWNLDAPGNWTGLSENDGPTESRTHNLQNEITGIGSTTLTYDANGNLTTDEQGRTLVWDAWNRLVQVKQGSTVLISYKYDGLKRRVVEDTGTQKVKR